MTIHVFPGTVPELGIQLDSPEWFEWLSQQLQFKYCGNCTEMSVKRRASNGKWYARKKVYSSDKGSVPIDLYVGTDSDCTAEKLIELNYYFGLEWQKFWQWYHSPARRGGKAKGVQQEMSTPATNPSQTREEVASKETTNAVRQWCVFARHNDGKLQFMGGYWTKGDAEAKMHKARREHHLSESIGDKPYIGPPPTYEVREILVAPVGLYNHSPSCTTETEAKVVELEAKLVVLRNSVEPLNRENERLREQIKEYREKLENSSAEVERLQSSSNPPDPSTILNRLRKERRKSKADLKDVELIIELLQAQVL